MSEGIRDADVRTAGLVWVALSCLVQAACDAPLPQPDPRLLESIDWYTGVAGQVDDERAKALLADAAADNDPVSVMWLARVHSRGRMGFPRDEDRARQLASHVIGDIERAARGGILEAVFLMGTAYDEALGKPFDADSAAAWHRRAAEAGHVLGAHNLGNAYAEGRGVTLDPAAAVRWWLQAAERGDAITQLRLGEAYESGTGVLRDTATALSWYRRAAAAGNEDAATAVARLTGVSGLGS